MTSRQRIVLSLSATLALALGLTRCVASERGAAPAEDATSVPTTDPAAVSGGTSGTSSGGALSAGEDVAKSSAEPGAAGPAEIADAGPRANPVAATMQRTDAVDRDLLADVERLTKKAPPPAVNELIAMRRRGASRAELAQFIDASFKGDMSLRTSCLRWLEQVEPSGRAPGTGAPGLSTTVDPHIKQPTRRRSGP